MSNGSEVDVGKAGVLGSPLAKKEVSSVPLSPKPAAQLEKKNTLASEHAAASPSCKAQVVGWPPSRSFRKNSMASSLAKNNDDAAGKQGSGCLYVKVSMDGAPYLRKVDLKTYNNYTELSMALEKMFSCFTIGQCSSNGLPERDGLSASRLMDLLNGSEFVLTFEDKDDDWMLVGDVPWQMFTETCRRLQTIKCAITGKNLYMRFTCSTGDVTGMNMVSKGVQNVLDILQNDFPDMDVIGISSNYCSDKKPAAVSWIEGRGKSVVCKAMIKGDVVQKVLKTNVASLCELNMLKNLTGSAMTAALGGFNAHASNNIH
ncbi:auxin-responsive protein IAA21-like [Pyrus x bretschneideri]|uniref:auxin-responsive protein IAA21-like n=1 Tax=Pyrus x bretschneideri TaxID=225117 RepID=UPI00202E503B|nr:auxin-responsive protein IAA21-like [Pyrus x bretschneideri]